MVGLAYFNHCLSVLYVVICQNIGILSVITTSQYSYSAAPVLHCPSVLVLVWAHLHTANAGLDCAELVTQLPHQYNLLHLLTSHITIYIMFLHYIHYQARSISAHYDNHSNAVMARAVLLGHNHNSIVCWFCKLLH